MQVFEKFRLLLLLLLLLLLPPSTRPTATLPSVLHGIRGA
jgi:hypothetical protein